MSEVRTAHNQDDAGDAAPGDVGGSVGQRVGAYLVGLGLAVLLTAASFLIPTLGLVYEPGLPWALLALAVAQIGVHLAFFLHLTTAPDNTNNVMALAFGVFIVVLVIGGSVWIMGHLNGNMMPGMVPGGNGNMGM